jgi:hypothetical protein
MDRFFNKNNNTRTKKEDEDSIGIAKETDPLIHASSHSSSGKGSSNSSSNNTGSNNNRSGNVLRSRRGTSQSPIIHQQIYSTNSTDYLSIQDNIRPMIGGNFDDTTTNNADDTSRSRLRSLAAATLSGGEGGGTASFDTGDAHNINDGYQSIEESLSSIQSRRVQRLEQQRQPDGQSPINDYVEPNTDAFTSRIRTNSSLGANSATAALLEKNSNSNHDSNGIVQKSSTVSSSASRRRRQATAGSGLEQSANFLTLTDSKGGSVSLSASIPAIDSATTRSSILPQDNAAYAYEQKQQNIQHQMYTNRQQEHDQQQVERDMPSDDDTSNSNQQRQFQQSQSRSSKPIATATVPVGISATKSSSYSTDNNDNARLTTGSDFRKGSRNLNKYNNVNTNNEPTIDNPLLASSGGGGGMIVGTGDGRSFDSEQPPLLEIPEEVYAVRKAALQVLKPLNKTWVRSLFFCRW